MVNFFKGYWQWVKENHLERIEVVNNIALIISIVAVVISMIGLFLNP